MPLLHIIFSVHFRRPSFLLKKKQVKNNKKNLENYGLSEGKNKHLFLSGKNEGKLSVYNPNNKLMKNLSEKIIKKAYKGI